MAGATASGKAAGTLLVSFRCGHMLATGRRPKYTRWLVVIGLPLLAWAAWLASGREVFTKGGKAVQVAVRNELFGDTDLQTQWARGPLFGWYVGLDVAVLVTLAALVAAGVLWWRMRRQRRRAAPAHGGHGT
jgi:hypothetical protein